MKNLFISCFLIILHSCGKTSGIAPSTSCDGKDYCIVFLTSATNTASGVGGISGADATCNTDSNKPNNSTYKALIVDSANRKACTSAFCSGGQIENKLWAFKPNIEYRRIDETAVIGTTNSAGIFSFPLNHSMTNTNDQVWTGLNTDWTSSSNNCSNWTSISGVQNGSTAATIQSDNRSIFVTDQSCNSLLKFLCVEQ